MAILLLGHERRFRKLERDQDALKLELAKLILERRPNVRQADQEAARLSVNAGAAARV